MLKRSPETPAPGANDPAARLQLSKAVQRARLALAWERLWPHLARVLTLAGLFLAVSWIGAWVTLPLPVPELAADVAFAHALETPNSERALRLMSHAVTEGTDAQAEVSVRLSEHGRSVSRADRRPKCE